MKGLLFRFRFHAPLDFLFCSRECSFVLIVQIEAVGFLGLDVLEELLTTVGWTASIALMVVFIPWTTQDSPGQSKITQTVSISFFAIEEVPRFDVQMYQTIEV